MVERKKIEKETKSVQIKATTGAWWKSKPSEDTVEVPATPHEQEIKVATKKAPRPKKVAPATKAKAPAAKAEKKPTRVPKPRRAPANKQVEPEKTTEVVQVEGQEGVTVPTTPPAKKPAPRKRTTKPRTPRAKAKPSEEAVLEGGVEDAPIAPEVKGEEVVFVEATEEVVSKPRSPKPRRARRPKAPAKQKAVVTDTDESPSAPIAPVINGAEVTPAEVVEEAVSAVKSPKPRRGRRPKAPVQKKAIVTDNDENPSVNEAGDEVVVASDSETIVGEEFESAVAKKRADKQPEGKRAHPPKVEEEVQEEVKKLSKLLINAEEPEECRLALLEDGRLESINVSTISRAQRKNNIYKARIVAIEPSLQAAFVEYGTDKNGFLPFSEIHPEYFKQDLSKELQHLVDTQQWKKLSITDVVERGQDILAQVVKEEVGKKGANMTTFLSIPGRCVVLMPGSDSSGISRRISGEQRRSQLRETMKSMDLPEGIGWIVRTASVDITQEALTRDVGYLLKLWEDIKGKGQTIEGVGLVYEEQHSVLRFLREHFDPSIQEILVDDRTALEQVKEFVLMLPKDQQGVTVRLHQGARPIFNQYSVEDQIESIYQPQVSLPSGGSIVIDPTEALVAIDVNSGSTSKGKNFEASIFQANMEAAVELARQLRLRDLGGLIVVDFIDMRSRKNISAVEKQVRAAMKKDKAKVDFSRISKFGLMEISRQKLGAPIEAGNYRRCEHCKGRGTVRSVETLSLFYLRRIQTGASRKPVERIECHFPLDVSAYLLNKKRTEISEMEKRYNVEITINADMHMKPSENEILFHKAEKETNNAKLA
ncbi:MAG: ribonuclease E [Desulforhopalus sp.]|jgi:ribonuclease E